MLCKYHIYSAAVYSLVHLPSYHLPLIISLSGSFLGSTEAQIAAADCIKDLASR